MKRVILLLVLILLISLAYSFAAVPGKINYQGRLIKDGVPVDGTRRMSFSIYNSVVGGTLRWTSGDVDITVYNGLFRYVLDLSTIDWAAGETLYLEVKVESDILTPREEIYASPYAINSHLLEGATKEYFLNTSAETQTKQGNLNITGNVGIGTTGPQAKLEIKGTQSTTPGTNLDMLFGTTGALGFRSADTGGYNHLYLDRYYGDTWQSTPVMTWRADGNVGIGTTSPTATLDVDGTVSIFGSWTTKDSLGNTLVKDAIYRATTDGFVCASIFCDTTNNAYINGYTGPSSPPPSVLTQGLPLGYSRYAAVTLPVRKDDYWKIGVQEGTPTIRWLPIGSGTCVKQ